MTRRTAARFRRHFPRLPTGDPEGSRGRGVAPFPVTMAHTTKRPNRFGSTGFSVSELAVSLVALLSMLAQGSISVGAGGSQSKATAFARQTMEQLRNQPFVPGPAN